MLIKYRRDLHQIPELAMQEEKTGTYLMNVLSSFKSFEIERVVKNGILAFKKSTNPSAITIGFRADMDALPIEENTAREFRSTHSGHMHACGHDGHMAMALELARRIDEKELNVNVLVIFQPAEENIGGAEKIVEGKYFDKYNPKAIFGMHIMPEIEEGLMGLRPGAIMAAASEIDVEIYGKASHCARPNEGVDAIVIGSEIVTVYNQLLAKRISPFASAILHIGSFHSGNVRNIVSNYAKLTGTIRTFDDDVLVKIKEEIERINKSIAMQYNAEIKTTIMDVYPTVVNDEELFELLTKLVGKGNYIVTEPSMAAEDFAYYRRVCPSIFSFLGSKSEKYNKPLHHGEFDFDERILEIGVNFYEKILEHYNAL